MRNGFSNLGSRSFGDPDHVKVERGLAEFRAGRPVRITSNGSALIALPVDGIDAQRLAAFRALCGPAQPSLVITKRRARALGLDGTGPVLLTLTPSDEAETIFALAASAQIRRPVEARPAETAAVAALELAKLVQRFPALLVADAAASTMILDPPLIGVEAGAVKRFRLEVVRSLRVAGDAKVPLPGGLATRFVVFRDEIGGGSAAVVVGEPDFSRPVPVRMHSACLTGDVFGSRRCDCGDQLKLALTRLKQEGGGVILYLDQEGRGLGLVNKIRAYNLQDHGLDTVDANTTLGFDDDERDYGIAARMLELLGCTRILLMTNNPAKLDALADAGIEITGRMPLNVPINADNRRYLTAKARRAGHWLEGVLAEEGGPAPAS